MTEQKPVLSESDLAAEDYHEKPTPGGPEGPLVPAPADALDPEAPDGATSGDAACDAGPETNASTGTPVEGDATATVAAASGEGTAADTDVDPASDEGPGDDVVPGEDR